MALSEEQTRRVELLLATHADREQPYYWHCVAHGEGLHCCLDYVLRDDVWATVQQDLGIVGGQV